MARVEQARQRAVADGRLVSDSVGAQDGLARLLLLRLLRRRRRGGMQGIGAARRRYVAERGDLP